MTSLHLILGLTSALGLLYCGTAAPEDTGFSKRFPRSADEPTAVDCELSKWSVWTECDPCTKEKYRSRSIVRFGQYGGKHCLSALGERQRCMPDKPCDERPPDCGNDFECESGRCIKQRLLCNVDNDCGDSSDESCDDGKDPKPVCRTDVELSEIGRTSGDGYNVLGVGVRSNAFDNEYFNGVCDRVRDGNTRTYYRKPWNVAALVYQTRADKTFTSEAYNDAVSTLTKITNERTVEFGASLSAKVTPSQYNSTTIKGKVGVDLSMKKSVENVKEYTTKTGKKFLRVAAYVQLGTFQMRSRNFMLSPTFIDDLKNLPSIYDKGEYFAFLETYGTHYAVSGSIGGKYELVYVLNSKAMEAKAIDTETVTKCLGFEGEISVAADIFDVSANAKPKVCNTVTTSKKDQKDESAVIEKTISFVEGGKIDLAAVLDSKLSQKPEDIGTELFSKWAASLIDSPVITKKKLEPIYSLVPVDLRDAYNKTKFLERAIEDYFEEYSVCKCQPCQNGGTVVHIDGECVCKCPAEFTGLACQTLRHEVLKKPDKPAEGNWSCWSPLPKCINGVATRTRTCNHLPGQTDKAPCRGESVKTVDC
ncbi:complement component C9-like [Pseudophryne corroboree]|uniref:complement component C9-like n=1 Tax=Pseudophryne corroboree TaxID=495146 RepID=UPI0030816A93